MGPVGKGFGEVLIMLIVFVAIIVGGAVWGIGKLTQPKEYVFKKRLVPELRLTTDGKKVDTVFVYKIK